MTEPPWITIISWNLLHGVGATLSQVADLVRRERPDLLVMQEATAAIDRLPCLVDGHYAREPLPGRLHGLAAWSPSPFSEAARSIALQPGVFVRRVCQVIHLGELTVANVHLSHGQVTNRRQLRRIAMHLPGRAAILGDCNMIGPPLLPGFRDVGPRQPTHAMATVIPLRLDRCLVRGLDCGDARILPRNGSDHSPIIVRLRSS